MKPYTHLLFVLLCNVPYFLPFPGLQGWSAAALANLMNEAAILTVRRNVPTITLPMVLELVEGINWGDKAPRIPDSAAKDRCGFRIMHFRNHMCLMYLI